VRNVLWKGGESWCRRETGTGARRCALTGLSPTPEQASRPSRLMPDIFSLWLAWPWFERQPARFVCLRRMPSCAACSISSFSVYPFSRAALICVRMD
jgi:hypothetical protein